MVSRGLKDEVCDATGADSITVAEYINRNKN